MTLIDVSVPIHAGMPIYEGDPPVEVTMHTAIAAGAPADVRRLVLGTHTGTHVDAPAHFIAGGATVDRLPLDVLVGPARVALPRPHAVITRESLEALCPRGAPRRPEDERLLLKTSNSAGWALGRFTREYVALDAGAADWIVERGVRLVGIDGLSVDPWDSPGFPAHRRLLGAGVVILEGLDLSRVEPGACELLCLPLPLRGLDGAPCRALLRTR
jgi:arylformamidase